MKTAGIDIGSRTVKLVVLEDGEVILQRVEYNSHDPIAICRAMLEEVQTDNLVATGYGRHLFEQYWSCKTITEIKAVALGAQALHPECRQILDIGGQDTKVVELMENGSVGKFEMNDKCAAGTGRFLEVMATALGYSMEDFVSQANEAEEAKKINAMCTVFAESEVISMVARGIPREQLALGLHQAVSKRSLAMLRRLRGRHDVLFCGGAAHNSCLHRLLQSTAKRTITVPEHPQTVAALGCARAAMEPSSA